MRLIVLSAFAAVTLACGDTGGEEALGVPAPLPGWELVHESQNGMRDFAFDGDDVVVVGSNVRVNLASGGEVEWGENGGTYNASIEITADGIFVLDGDAHELHRLVDDRLERVEGLEAFPGEATILRQGRRGELLTYPQDRTGSLRAYLPATGSEFEAAALCQRLEPTGRCVDEPLSEEFAVDESSVLWGKGRGIGIVTPRLDNVPPEFDVKLAAGTAFCPAPGGGIVIAFFPVGSTSERRVLGHVLPSGVVERLADSTPETARYRVHDGYVYAVQEFEASRDGVTIPAGIWRTSTRVFNAGSGSEPQP